jgi:hypothetical protein
MIGEIVAQQITAEAKPHAALPHICHLKFHGRAVASGCRGLLGPKTKIQFTDALAAKRTANCWALNIQFKRANIELSHCRGAN